MRTIYSLLIYTSISIIYACSEKQPVKEVIIERDTVIVTETPPRDSFMVYGHIEFPSKDGLLITANSYEYNVPNEPYIILCHQAGYSRGEYRETAKELNTLGYNCLAIDLRSGKECNKMINETAARATDNKLPANYADAEQDILAAIDYVHAKTGKNVILLGSSYSASLVLKIATENDKVSAAIAFSPGEYIPGTNIAQNISDLNKPVFITSSKKEAKEVSDFIKNVKSTIKEHFIPAGQGEHGSKALWTTTPNHAEYWDALKAFLNKINPKIH
jgi:dienelactone hydrolase